MNCLNKLAVFALAAVYAAASLASDPSLSPQQGVLVLRNGQVMQGKITQEGNRYIVAFPQGGEARLEADKVEMVCVSMEQAYLVKKSRRRGENADSHLDLAEWCLRHGMVSCAADQILEAIALNPRKPRLEVLQRRLVFVQEASLHPRRSSARTNQTTLAAAAALEKLERRVEELPEASIQRFTSQIQPFLINRCGASSCHGMRSTSEFQLIRPLTGKASSQRATQRNLVAALKQAQGGDPAKSPLIQALTTPHGGQDLSASTAAWQIERLRRWVEISVAPAAKPMPRTLAVPDTRFAETLPTALGRTGEPKPAARLETRRRATPPRKEDPAFDAGRDPFDPAKFNQRHFGENRKPNADAEGERR